MTDTLLDDEADTAPVTATDPARIQAIRDELGLLDEQETADVLGVEVRTLRDWIKRGTGPDSILLGRKRWFPVASLQAHLAYVAKVGGVPYEPRRNRRAAA